MMEVSASSSTRDSTPPLPTIPEAMALPAVRACSAAAAMTEQDEPALLASPVLTGRRSPPPAASPPLTKLPALRSTLRLLPPLTACLDASSPEDEPEDDEMAADKPERRGTARKKGTRRGTLHPEAKSVLKAWMFSPAHFAHPYPSEDEKEQLAREAGIEVKQLSNWFTNARKRLWQPVLRQSGVEVKNFLSTGRGGPRGSKLEMPPHLQQLVASSAALVASALDADDAEDADADMGSPLKRSWAAMHASLLASPSSGSSGSDEPVRLKKRSRKKPRRLALGDDHHRLAAAETSSTSPASVARFGDVELLAAASLLGLHAQPPSVH